MIITIYYISIYANKEQNLLVYGTVHGNFFFFFFSFSLILPTISLVDKKKKTYLINNNSSLQHSISTREIKS